MTTVVTAGASAIPVFVLGFMLQYGFAVLPEPARLARVGAPAHVAARAGHVDASSSSRPGSSGATWSCPAITLASVSTALAARMTRGSMLEVLRADYMRTARAKGLRERDVVVRHGLRNAMLPVDHPDRHRLRHRDRRRRSSPRTPSPGRGSARRSPTPSSDATCP